MNRQNKFKSYSVDNNIPLTINIDYQKQPSGKISPALKKAVLDRDHMTCKFCGFYSEKYQQVSVTGNNIHDIDTMFSACIFCNQLFNLEQIKQMRSGILVWLPEIDQATLNHVARDLYRARLTNTPDADRAREIIKMLCAEKEPDEKHEPKSRRLMARNKLGTDDVTVLLDIIEAGKSAANDLNETLKGIRLFPLDRRIIRESDIKFNQFPQILAYWRSKNGPLKHKSYPWLNCIEDALGITTHETGDHSPAVNQDSTPQT